MFWVTLLNQIYWVSGTALGAFSGSIIPFDTEGLDFVLTAMFVVIFLERFLSEKNHLSGFIRIAASLFCLVIFGSQGFIIPSMLVMLALLLACRPYLEDKLEDDDNKEKEGNV